MRPGFVLCPVVRAAMDQEHYDLHMKASSRGCGLIAKGLPRHCGAGGGGPGPWRGRSAAHLLLRRPDAEGLPLLPVNFVSLHTSVWGALRPPMSEPVTKQLSALDIEKLCRTHAGEGDFTAEL